MRNILKISFLALLFSGFAFSQEAQTITLGEAVGYALQNQADAKKAKLKIENSEYLIQEARAGALPSLSGNGNITYNPILQESALPGEFFGQPGETILVPFGQKWSSTVGVQLNQNLFDQTVFTGLKAAKTTREFYQINAQLTEEQVIERVATAYYNVFVQKEQLETIDSSYINIAKSRDIIKSLFDNGLAREIDLDRVNVQLMNLSTTRQQLVNAVQIQENALKFYMGMQIAQPIELADEDFTAESHLLADKADTENRTEMKVLKKQEELLMLQKDARKAAYYPSLSLVASYNYQGLGDKFPVFANENDGVFWSDYSMIGLNLKIPIFNGFATKARISQADIELRTLQEDIKNTELSLDLEYQNAKSQIENNLIAIENQQENVSLAQKVVNNTENNYRQGLATLTDLLEAQNALVDARNNYSNALLQYKLAEIQLLKSTGELKSLTEK